MPNIRRGTKSLMADHAALQPVWRVVRSFHDSPPSPELREYAQAALFLAHHHLDHHSAVKLVEGFIVIPRSSRCTAIDNPAASTPLRYRSLVSFHKLQIHPDDSSWICTVCEQPLPLFH